MPVSPVLEQDTKQQQETKQTHPLKDFAAVCIVQENKTKRKEEQNVNSHLHNGHEDTMISKWESTAFLWDWWIPQLLFGAAKQKEYKLVPEQMFTAATFVC